MKLTTRVEKKKVATPTPKAKYEPNSGEKLLLSWVDALRSGEFSKLKNPSVALRGKKGEYSASGVLTELIRQVHSPNIIWDENDPIFKTYTIDGYAFELPIWCINYMINAGLAGLEVIAVVDLCYDIDHAATGGNTFDIAADTIEKLVKGWIKEKGSDLVISDAEWDEIYLVAADVIDLSKGKMTATDWKKISQIIRSKSTETTVGTWRGFVGRLAKKLGATGERAAAQYKQVPDKVLNRVGRLRSNLNPKQEEVAAKMKIAF